MKKIFIGAILMFSLIVLAAVGRSCNETQVRNVIVLVGDGMGLAEVSYTDEVSDSTLFIERVDVIGLVRTYSYTNRVTDSAAAATAFACGVKTNNGVLGMDHNLQPVESILERAEAKGMATGLVATYSVTHATPAGYAAHRESRKDAEGIAEDILGSGVDVLIGGGRKFFEKRGDGRNLSDDLIADGYSVVYNIDDVDAHRSGRLAAFLADNGLPTMLNGRGDMLPRSANKAIELLNKMGGDKGFFVMIEGSQIDGEGHNNNADGIVAETLDFDAAVQIALDYAEERNDTLVLIFADHETGGLTLPADGKALKPAFSTGGHTGVMVPIYAYGAGAEHFSGVMENTDIAKRIAELLEI